jgi:hypothetical protein
VGVTGLAWDALLEIDLPVHRPGSEGAWIRALRALQPLSAGGRRRLAAAELDGRAFAILYK